MLLSQSLWNSLLSKGFISIKADKTSNDLAEKQSWHQRGKAKLRVYLSPATLLRDNQDKDDSTFFEMQHRGVMRLQLLEEQNQTKCLFFHKCLLVLFKKGHRFQLMKQGIEYEVLRDVD